MLVRPGFEPTASRSADRRLSHWANRAAVEWFQHLYRAEKWPGSFVFQREVGGGGSLYLFIVVQIMSYALTKQHSLYPSSKGVLKFSYEHPVIFTCILVSLRIEFDWAKSIYWESFLDENPVYKIGWSVVWKIQCCLSSLRSFLKRHARTGTETEADVNTKTEEYSANFALTLNKSRRMQCKLCSNT